MIFGQDREELRQMYVDAWQKARDGQPLTPLEAEIAEVIEHHPEYHAMLEKDAVQKDFLPEMGQTNPFLHMGLHLALRDQLKTGRPSGIQHLHGLITARAADAHEAEHRMIECLAETLWEAQAQNQPPDEQQYLARLRRQAGLGDD